MPMFKFEAMDPAGEEVKDSIDAINEEEAQQKIKQMGYFVTKITEVTGKGKGKGKGKAGGALETILQRLADFKEKAQSLKRKIIGAMVYPTVVILVAVAILMFIMIAIIPKFKKIFKDFNMKLPWATETLIATSDWFMT